MTLCMTSMILMLIAAPSAPPSSVSVGNVTFFSITVHWGAVPCTARNGAISGYLVSYSEVDKSDSLGSASESMGETVQNTTASAKTMARCRGGSGSDDMNDNTNIEGESNNTEGMSATELTATLTGLRTINNILHHCGCYQPRWCWSRK